MNQRELEALNAARAENIALKSDNQHLRTANAHLQMASHEKDRTILWLRERLKKQNPADEAAETVSEVAVAVMQ